jgi:antitoxin ParD1/3/4
VSTSPLPPDLEQFVFDQLAKGKYQSATDVVCDAVRLMRERETKLELLRLEIDRGLSDIEAGNFIELDSEDSLQAFFDDIEARSRKRRSTMQAEQ